MKGKLIALLVFVVLTGMLGPSPVMATEDPPSILKICKEHRYIPNVGWVCVDSLPVSDIAHHRSAEKKGETGPAVTLGSLGKKPDPNLTTLPYHYLQVMDARVPLYLTLEDAVAKSNSKRSLIPGFDYVSFDRQVQVDGKWYYHTASGFWMSGREAAYLGNISTFQGLMFDRTPDTDFGWVLREVRSQRKPDSTEPAYKQARYQRYEVVRILEERRDEGAGYLQVGEEEWLPAESVGRVARRNGPPEGVESDRWIDINLDQQTLAVYEGREMVFATLVSSGLEGNWTRPGTFEIKEKLETELMRGSFAADRSDYYYLENVPWTMYFDEARALHGTYWHDQFGTPQSKGCVNLSPGDARWIFEWAVEGEVVHVYDPSGETPTDPGRFHRGGA